MQVSCMYSRDDGIYLEGNVLYGMSLACIFCKYFGYLKFSNWEKITVGLCLLQLDHGRPHNEVLDNFTPHHLTCITHPNLTLTLTHSTPSCNRSQPRPRATSRHIAAAGDARRRGPSSSSLASHSCHHRHPSSSSLVGEIPHAASFLVFGSYYRRIHHHLPPLPNHFSHPHPPPTPPTALLLACVRRRHRRHTTAHHRFAVTYVGPQAFVCVPY